MGAAGQTVLVVFYGLDGAEALVLRFEEFAPYGLRASFSAMHGGYAGRGGSVWFLRQDLEAFAAAVRAFAPSHEGEANLASFDPLGGAEGASGVSLRVRADGMARRAVLEISTFWHAWESPERARLELSVELAPSHWNDVVALLQRVLDAPLTEEDDV